MIVSILNFFISREHVIEETLLPMPATYHNSQVTLEIIVSALDIDDSFYPFDTND